MNQHSAIKIIRIGRSSQCEFIIADPTVSRLHAELHIYPDGRLYLQDTNSTAGIQIERVHASFDTFDKGWVEAQDHIRLGKIELKIADIMNEFQTSHRPEPRVDYSPPPHRNPMPAMDGLSSYWRDKSTVTVVTALILIMMSITNPDKTDFSKFVAEEIKNRVDLIANNNKSDPMTTTLAMWLGGLLGDLQGNVISSSTKRTNFLFFSLYEAKTPDKHHLLALGIFNHFILLQDPFKTIQDE